MHTATWGTIQRIDWAWHVSKPIALASSTCQPYQPNQPACPSSHPVHPSSSPASLPNQPPATQPTRQPAHPRRLPSVTAEGGGKCFFRAKTRKLALQGPSGTAGRGQIAQDHRGPGFAPSDAMDGFGPQVRHCRHFLTSHRALFSTGKLPSLKLSSLLRPRAGLLRVPARTVRGGKIA